MEPSRLTGGIIVDAGRSRIIVEKDGKRYTVEIVVEVDCCYDELGERQPLDYYIDYYMHVKEVF